MRGEIVLLLGIENGVPPLSFHTCGGNHKWVGGGCFLVPFCSQVKFVVKFFLNSYLDARLQAAATQKHASVIPAFVPGCLGGEKQVLVSAGQIFFNLGIFLFGEIN